MLPPYVALIGIAIASIGGLYYLYCTIQGTVRPNKITWFFWGAFPLVAFAAQMSQGVGLMSWVTFVSGALPLSIFLASFWNPAAHWDIQPRDYVFAGIGVLSIFLWYITDNPNIAITFSILADIAVSIPTIIKAYTSPETETWHFFGLNTVGFALGVLAIQQWTYEQAAFVIFLFAINLFFTVLVLRPRQS